MQQERLVIVAGASTGVGKTVFSALLTQIAIDAQVTLRVLKPISTGGQEDAEFYASLLSEQFSLRDINPWYYARGLAPLLAARQQNALPPSLEDVSTWIRSVSSNSELTIVEGAGGVLTPLGEGYSIVDVGKHVGGHFVVVVSNLLGAINQSRLSYEVLLMNGVSAPTIVLMDAQVTDASSESNLGAVSELCARSQVIRIPHITVRNHIDIPRAIYTFLKNSLEISEGSGRTLGVLCELAGVRQTDLVLSRQVRSIPT